MAVLSTQVQQRSCLLPSPLPSLPPHTPTFPLLCSFLPPSPAAQSLRPFWFCAVKFLLSLAASSALSVLVALVMLKETGEPIGAMGYGPSCQCKLPAREGEPLIGYWVARPYWNRGICTEALWLMLDHIRQNTDIKSLISGHFIDNPASGRVMEKCGFVPTGETVIDLDQSKDTPIRVLRLELCA